MNLKRFIDICFSLRTTLWLLGVVLVMFFAGAVIMPGRKEFQEIHAMPMFQWLEKQPLGITWWLWCLIGVLSFLTLNTLFCSIESLIKKRKVTRWLLLISPQIIHAGFLCILLAHLLSAVGSSQTFMVAGEGSLVKLSDDNAYLKIEDIKVLTDTQGYMADWEVKVTYLFNDRPVYGDSIRPNKPSLRKGLNIIVKDLRKFPHKAVLLQMSREPGAFWALLGGMLTITGTVILIILRIKTEKGLSA
jgi:hypothetical protein